MLKALVLSAAILGLAAPAAAAPCRDAKGHFIKCPPATAKTVTTTKTVRCKDAKGKFAKCGTPGAKPVA